MCYTVFYDKIHILQLQNSHFSYFGNGEKKILHYGLP